jgi:hypothetical protein
MDRRQDIVTRYLNNPEFRAIVDQELARRTYDEIRGGESPAPSAEESPGPILSARSPGP